MAVEVFGTLESSNQPQVFARLINGHWEDRALVASRDSRTVRLPLIHGVSNPVLLLNPRTGVAALSVATVQTDGSRARLIELIDAELLLNLQQIIESWKVR